MADFGKELYNKLAQHDKNYQVEHDLIRSETHILEEMEPLHLATKKRIVEMDAGNQQLLEKLLGVEKDLDGKLQGANDNAMQTKDNSSLIDRLTIVQDATTSN